MSENIIFDTLFDTVSQKILIIKQIQLDQCFEKFQGIPRFQAVAATLAGTFSIKSPKSLTFDNLFDTVSQSISKLM